MVECTYVVASDVTSFLRCYRFMDFLYGNNRLGCGWCAVIGTGPDRSVRLLNRFTNPRHIRVIIA